MKRKERLLKQIALASAGASLFCLPVLNASAKAVIATPTISSSSDWSSCEEGNYNYTAQKAFDNNAATAWHTGCGIYSQYNPWSGINDWFIYHLNTGWIQYDFGIKKLIDTYAIQPSNLHVLSYAPKSWTFEGWDGTKWVILDTQANVTGWAFNSFKTFKFTNSTLYRAYRLNITANSGANSVAISEIKLSGPMILY